MGLEAATYIHELVASNPAGGDPRQQGDDHIRTIKGALKNTFPNISGPMTRTHTELNAAACTGSQVKELLGYTPLDTRGGQIDGALVTTGNITAFSDERLKHDWSPLSGKLVHKLANVKVGEYTNVRDGKRAIGLSAQSARRAMPHVTFKYKGYWTVDYSRFAAVGVVALAQEVEELKREIKELKKLLKVRK